MGENVSKVLWLAGKARAGVLAEQDAVSREVSRAGYWGSQLAAFCNPAGFRSGKKKSASAPRVAPRNPARSRSGKKKSASAPRVALTYGAAHRLYRARKVYDWSASRAAEAFGITAARYRSAERIALRRSPDEPLEVTHRGERIAVTVGRDFLVKASRIYHDPYFKEFADANA